VVATSRLPVEVETAAFRVVQEAMTNVVRHARAKRAGVAITRHDGQVTVAVEDDGVGFDPNAVPPGRLGLIGMRERVSLANGTLEIESARGQGTTLLARFPVPAEGR
jgi:signal transduction histidine kinase